MTTLSPPFKKGDHVRLARVATEDMVRNTGLSLMVNREFMQYGLKPDPEFGSVGWVTEVFVDGYVAVAFDDYPKKVVRKRAHRNIKKANPLHFPAGCFDKVG